MKKLTIMFSVALIILFTMTLTVGCQPPQAMFEANVTSGEALLTVDFTNKTETSLFKKADEYKWDFGDGTAATTTTIEETVTHDYAEAGIYTVTMTVIKSGEPPQTSTMTLTITVTHGPLDSAYMYPRTVELDIGQSQEFTTEILDAYGNPILEAQLTWEVVGEAGTITNDGVLTGGTKAGIFEEAVIFSARLNSIYIQDMASVTIRPDPLGIVTTSPVNVTAGETRRLGVTTTDPYGNPLDDVEVTWSVSDEYAGSITSEGIFTAGEIVGYFPDVVEARATQDGLVRTATTSVRISPGPLEQMVIAPDPAEMGMEMTQQFVVVGADEYGNLISDLNFNWSVQSGGGTIDSTGLFTAGNTHGTYNDTVKVEATHGGVTQSATADVTVEPDRIVFLSNRDYNGQEGAYDIYIMTTSGSNQERLTTGGAFACRFSCSPDGRRIIYSDDGNIIVITDEGDWDFTLISGRDLYDNAWSLDGAKFAFQSWSSEHDSAEIYVADVDGGNFTRLTYNSDYEDYPAWSPDGTKIVFVSDRDGNLEIYVMNANGSNQRRLTNNSIDDVAPVWSPDGTEILFQSIEANYLWGIYIMNADGTNMRRLTPTDFSSRFPTWSPDGTRIAFHGFRHTDEGEIYIMDRDGSNITRLTNNSDRDYIPIWLPRKSGVEVTEASAILPNVSTPEPMTVEEVTALARKAVVRIVTDLGTGSGFIIDPDGLIMTNNHVISDAEEITVYLDDGTEYTGTVRGRDLVRDLALVKIPASGLPFLEIGDLSGIGLGQQIIVIGYPMGTETVTVTTGVVSAIKFDSGKNVTWIQTDSVINLGNSGGPMLNLQGQVIGVVSLIVRGWAVEGVGYAVSASTIDIYLSRLEAGETITQ